MVDSRELTEPEAAFVYTERSGEPWTVHVEVHVSGRIDPERFLAAARCACELHPMARASLATARRRDRQYRWEIGDQPSQPGLDVVEAGEEDVLADVRARLLRTAPALDEAPPFRLALVHRAAGDVLLLCVHHAVCDGMAAWRLMSSICRAYAGVDDPTPALDPLEARDPRPLVAAARRERLRRLAWLAPALARAGTPPVRLAGRTTGREGDGVCLLSFDASETAALERHRRGGATLNDVMLGALALAVRRWNRERGGSRGRIALMIPMNVRPTSWKEEVLGNFSSFIPFSIPASVPDSLDALVTAATVRTQRAKRERAAEAVFDMLIAITRRLSIGQKRRFSPLIFTQMHERLQDTAILSNLGRLTIPADFGEEAGRVRGAWFTPPVRWTRGFGVGALAIDGRLHVAFRHSRRRFDDDDAAAFAALFRDALLEGERSAMQIAPAYS